MRSLRGVARAGRRSRPRASRHNAVGIWCQSGEEGVGRAARVGRAPGHLSREKPSDSGPLACLGAGGVARYATSLCGSGQGAHARSNPAPATTRHRHPAAVSTWQMPDPEGILLALWRMCARLRRRSSCSGARTVRGSRRSATRWRGAWRAAPSSRWMRSAIWSWGAWSR